jgi:hypothetical protein
VTPLGDPGKYNMSNLFKRAIVATDLHLGLKSNSTVHNEDCWKFMSWAAELGQERQCDTFLFLGDYHNNRSTVNVMTLNYSLRILEMLGRKFDSVYMIPGNHDIYHRDRRDIQSLAWARHVPNLTIVNDWFSQGDVVIAPWLIGDDWTRVKKQQGRYMFGHFELPNFLMNAQVAMPDHGLIKQDDFQGFEHVFSGHFHKRQTQRNITYIGNCFPHNYSDAGDDQRGVMILEWGQEPEYVSWPDQPTYHRYLLSELVQNHDQLLRANQHVKVNIDMDISYEEAAFIRETFVEQYQLRDISLVPQANNELENTVAADIKFQSVDQIVCDQLSVIDSAQYDKNLLLTIYRDL